MPSLKDYNKKLASLRNMHKMTKTMKMVSATKFHRALEAQVRLAPYAAQLQRLLRRFADAPQTGLHPLCVRRLPARRVLLVIVSSNRGLCGSFNHALHRLADRWLEEHKDRYETLAVVSCSRKATAFLRGRASLRASREELTASPAMASAAQLADELMRWFLDGAYDEVHLAYNHFVNAMTRQPRREVLLPAADLPAEEPAEGEFAPAQYLFEPPAAQLRDVLIPRAVRFKLFSVLLENAVGEHGARMTAMDNATKNTERLMDEFTLLRNRARQAGITRELIEIVTGAEALKG
ncbi:MAG: ATP synthase F1 subunit gamma [Kiritimatiellaeota bacterium]|nr:ATP synthase F1 subunit gamma [Kiritimatiellota bacterium]